MGILSSLWGERAPKILAVDDDPNVRALVKELLEANGYSVECAQDGLEGLARYKKERFDLLILDHNMPHMSGAQLLEAIRGMPEGKSQAILMLSSEKMLGPIYKAYELGIIEWIVKPFPIQAFLDKVIAHLNAIKAR